MSSFPAPEAGPGLSVLEVGAPADGREGAVALVPDEGHFFGLWGAAGKHCQYGNSKEDGFLHMWYFFYPKIRTL